MMSINRILTAPARTTAGALLALATAAAAPGAFAATFPTNPSVIFQTSGSQRCANIGDWYTTVNGSVGATSSPEPCATNNGTNSTSTARYSEFFLEVTESMAPATIEILDAESTAGLAVPGAVDEVSNASDPTRFEVRSGDGVTLLQGQTVLAGTADGFTVTFSSLPVGLYRIRSYTGSDEVAQSAYGTRPVGENDDDNSFKIRVNGGAAIDGLLGFLQTTYQQSSGGTLDYQMYFMVGPALANSTLQLRNFDLDGGGTALYNRAPDATGAAVAGTVSGNGVWNGGGSLNAGQDNVLANNAIGAGAADAGTWGYRIQAWTNDNQTIFEANNTGVRLALTDTIPTRAGFFTITPNTTRATTIGAAVDHGFTVTNLFFTADLINFSLSGTSANYTVQLRTDPNCDGNGADGAVLGDLDGNGQPDTGLLGAASTAGASACFVLRTTPNSGASTSDTTRVSAVSFMDTKVVPSSNTTRFVEKTTLLPPAISKNFSPNPLATGGTATLTFTLTNINSVPVTLGSAATAYAFTDTFPVSPGAMTLANTTVTNTCGGTLTDGAGGALNVGDVDIRYSGGTIPAVGSCTVAVNVTASAIGDYANTSTAITSTNAGNGGIANATLTVQATTPPSVVKSFGASPIPLNGTSVLTLTISNSNSTALTGIAVSDTYPAGLVNRTAGPAANPATSCSGAAITGGANGGNTIGITGGTLAANSSCTVTVNVSSASAGSYLNSTGAVTSTNGGTGNTGLATLVVNAPPTVSKSFSPSPINNGSPSVLTITLSNPNSVAMTGAAFTDTYPAAPAVSAIVNAGAPNGSTTCGGGSVTAASGGVSVALANGVIPANGSCVVTVNVTKNTAGTGTNTIPAGGVATTNGVNSTVAASANLASQAVAAPAAAKSFAPTTIQTNGTSTLTLVVSNANPTATLVGVTMNDTYPANLVNRTPANAVLSCTAGSTGTLTGGADGGNSLGLTGATLLAGGSCTLTASVTSANTGTYNNSSGAPGSSNGGTGTAAAATLTVTGTVQPPTIEKVFVPDEIGVGMTSVLTFTITNANNQTLNNVTFLDTYPAGLDNAATPAVSSNCDNAAGGTNGTTGGVANGDTIGLTGGSNDMPANTTCTVQVTVTSTTAGAYDNVSGVVDSTSSAGDADTASATLTVVRPTLTKAFSPAVISSGGTATLTLVLGNTSDVAFTIGNPGFTDTFPTGMTVAAPLTASNSCGGTLNDSGNGGLAAGDLGLRLNGGTIPAKATCTITVNVTASTSGSYVNTIAAGNLSTNGGTNAVAATDTLTVPNRPTITKAFNAASVPVLGVSALTITLSNNNPVPATNASFLDTLPTGLVTSGSPSTSCGGVASNTSNSVSLSGGTIPAGAPGTCTVTINVLNNADTSATVARAANVYANTIAAGALTTDFGTNAAAGSANLNVLGGYKSLRLQTDADSSGGPTVGDTLQWSVFYRNPAGSVTIPAFQVTDAVGANLTVTGTPTVSYTPAACSTGAANGAFNGAGNPNLFTAPFAFNANCTVRVDYSVTVGAGAPGTTLANQASGSGTGLVATQTDNVDTTTSGLPAGVTPTAGSIAQAQVATVISPTTVAIAQRPTVTKSFSDSTIPVRGTSQLTISLGNANAGAITLSSALIDTLATGIVVATPNGLAGTCTLPSVAAAAGSGSVSYASGASIPAGGCTIQVNVRNNASTDDTVANAAGVYANTIAAGALQTNAGSNASPGTANLNLIGAYKSVRLLTDADSSSSVTAGDTLRWSVFFHNPTGSTNVVAFQATDTIGANMTVTGTPTVSYSPAACSTGAANGAFNGAGSPNLFTAAFTLNANCTVRIDYSVTVGAGAGGTTLANQASGSGTGLAATLTDNIDNATSGLPAGVAPTAGSITQTQSDTTVDPTTAPAQASANLSITKSDGQSAVGPGATLTYTIVASNAGPNNVTGAAIADTFAPATYAVGSVTWTCALTAGTGDCNTAGAGTGASGSGNISLPNVQLNSGASVTLTVTAPLNPAFTGTASNTATIAAPGGTFDPVPANNSATDTTVVNAALTVTKISAVLTDPVNCTVAGNPASCTGVPKRIPGAVIEYTLTIDNSGGSAPADLIVLSDAIPPSANITYVAETLTINGVGEDDNNTGADETNPNGGDFGQTAADTVTGRIATIAAGASATVAFRVTVK